MEQDSITFGHVADGEDRATLRDVYDVGYRRLVVQLYDVTGDLTEAEELVQAAFARAAVAERRFRRADDPEAWLLMAALKARRPASRRFTSSTPRTQERVLPAVVPPGFDELVRGSARRRMRRRTRLAATAYALATVAGAVVLVDDGDPSRPGPSSALVPLRAGLSEVEEVGDRGSGVYSAIRHDTAGLHLATYVVDGVVRHPCRSSDLSPVPGTTTATPTDVLAGLHRAGVAVPPHTVPKWGTTAVHLRVRVTYAECRNGNPLWTFVTRRRGEFLGNRHATLDFWVVELRGRAVVVEAELPIGATPVERRALTRLLDSVELHESR